MKHVVLVFLRDVALRSLVGNFGARSNYPFRKHHAGAGVILWSAILFL